MKKIIFLDRDGVLNEDTGYLHKIEDLHWVTGAKEALKLAYDAGYEFIIVTNQSGVARGYYTEAEVKTLHEYMCKELEEFGAPILDIYYCPHLEGAPLPQYDKACNCRKPKPGMILQAMSDYDIDKAHSFLIGDSPRDVEAAEAAGLRGYLFTGDNLAVFMKSIL